MAQYRLRDSFQWTVALALLAHLVHTEAGSNQELVRPVFQRSFDGLRLQDNQFVRGVPCEAACEHCGCDGINLGEKCVCFCGADSKESTNCLSAIRKEELKAGIDNDFLILTRTGARFARDIPQMTSLRARMGRGASVAWNTNAQNANHVLSENKSKKPPKVYGSPFVDALFSLGNGGALGASALNAAWTTHSRPTGPLHPRAQLTRHHPDRSAARCWVARRPFAKTYGKVEDEAVRRSGKWDLILVKYGRPSIRAYQNRAMTFRNTAGACVFWCLVGLILAEQPARLSVRADDDDTLGEFMELGWNEHGSISPEELCRSLCGECQCRGQLVSENLCQCSCDFAPANGGGEQNCTAKVQRLCNQMDVQCDFNGPDEADLVRSARGCHSMSCYEKHHGHEDGGYHHGDGYEGYEEGYQGHGPKELICCKDKKHKEKKHKHKKHKKLHHKHMKFHVVIKGKIPEPSCHGGGDEEGEHYDGGYDEHEGYRSAVPQGHPKNVEHKPMDVSVWTNRQKSAKKHPFRRPIHQHQQHPPSPYAAPPAYPAPYPESRGKSAEPPMPEVMPESQDIHPPPPPPPQSEETPQVPAPPSPPAEPKSSPVTPLPERPLTPPPNLYDGAPVGPQKSQQQAPSKPHSFSPPPPPPPPSMITVDPPPKRKESARAYSEPSCEFDSYDFNFYHPPPTYHPPPPPTYHPPPPPTYHPPPPPLYHPPPPPPPTYHAPPPSYHKPAAPSYRSSSSSQYKPPPPPPPHASSFYPEPPYHASHYPPHHDQYESPKHYSAYEKPLDYSPNDDSYDGNDYEGDYDDRQHGVHAFSDQDVDDWPDYPPRHPADILTYNQIVSRQIIEADTVQRYTDRPFQPTPRPLQQEFEPPTAEVGPVLFDSFGPPDKNYEMYAVPTPPPDAYIPPEPPALVPVQFPEPENGPATFPPNSEEALYPQPTPPPHYLLMKEAGSFSSFGFDDGSPSGFGRYDHERQHVYRGASQGRSSSSRRYH